jgi:hypothetical protein
MKRNLAVTNHSWPDGPARLDVLPDGDRSPASRANRVPRRHARGPTPAQHCAFLVNTKPFSTGHRQLAHRHIRIWADPVRRPGEINHRYGGLGVDFADPDLMELVTVAYGHDPG